jgi:hypothetical protein
MTNAGVTKQADGGTVYIQREGRRGRKYNIAGAPGRCACVREMRDE